MKNDDIFIAISKYSTRTFFPKPTQFLIFFLFENIINFLLSFKLAKNCCFFIIYLFHSTKALHFYKKHIENQTNMTSALLK